MKSSEIRELSNQELLEHIDNEKSALVRMKLNHAISPLENPQKIKESRRTIARLITEKHKREMNDKTK
jgi:large subunit ribosomal protein L29